MKVETAHTAPSQREALPDETKRRMTMITWIDCSSNARGPEAHIAYDTWNMSTYALLEKRMSGWAILYPDDCGGYNRPNNDRYVTLEAAKDKVHQAFDAEAPTP